MLCIQGKQLWWSQYGIDRKRLWKAWKAQDLWETYACFQPYIKTLMDWEPPDEAMPPLLAILNRMGYGDLDEALERWQFFKENADCEQEIMMKFSTILKQTNFHDNRISDKGCVSMLGKEFNKQLIFLIDKFYFKNHPLDNKNIEIEFDDFYPDLDIIAIKKVREAKEAYWHYIYFKHMGYTEKDLFDLWHISDRTFRYKEQQIWQLLKKKP